MDNVTISTVTVETIRPTYFDQECYRRTTVRTFKVSHRSPEELEYIANTLLEAFLMTNPGTIGTWTTSTWYNRKPEGV